MPRNNDPAAMHPQFRALALELTARCATEGLPLALYEGARSPWRQAELYARGRTTGTRGSTVTRARAWQSKHNYGMAADWVFRVNGAWSWDEPEKGMWQRFQALGFGCGLHPLSFEKPHMEQDHHLAVLQAGKLPEGDASFTWWYESEIERWGQSAREIDGIVHPGAPPLALERPVLDESA